MTLEGTLAVDVTPDGVEFEFTIANAGTTPVEVTLRSGAVSDVVVFEDDAEVWRWSDGRMVTQALRTVALAPGETFTHVATWEDPPTGAYTAEATLEATDHELVARESFTVEG